MILDPEDVPETPMFENKKVCICLPWYKSTAPRTSFSVTALCDRKKTAVMLDFGDAFIAHSRNKLADNFLKSNMEWMLTIDDDMVVPFGNAKLFNSFTGFNIPEEFAGRNTIDRLLSHGKTLVGGLYFGRWVNGKPVYAEGGESKQEEDFARQGPHDLLKPTRWVGTGCMLIHRTVFTDIEKTFPHLARNNKGVAGQWFTSSEHDTVHAVSEALKLLEDSHDNVSLVHKILLDARRKSNKFSGMGVGEDVVFCHRAAQSGHPAYVDLGLLCGHTGDFCFGPKKQV